MIPFEKTTKPLASPQKMIREEDKDAAVYKIVEKLQNSSLFLEMKADLEVKLTDNTSLLVRGRNIKNYWSLLRTF